MSPTEAKYRTNKDSEYLKILGKYIRQWREKRGLTQEEFSSITKFGRSYITEIETGKRNISFLNFVQLIKDLDVTNSDIIDFLTSIKEKR